MDEHPRGDFAPPTQEKPRRMRLPRSRRLTIDLLHYHAKVPTCAHDRNCDFRHVVEARKRSALRVSWSMIFIKAFGLVAQRYPVLRQMYLPLPWPHIYQHPTSVAMVATHRDYCGEPWLFWSRFTNPERRPLAKLQATLEQYQSAPVEEAFPWQFQLSGLPTPVRRLLWSWTFHVGGPARVRRAGTFFLTTIAGQGAEIQHPPAFLTSNCTYGPIDEQGQCRVTIAYDHRLMDGRLVANVLADLEAALAGPIADELATIHSGVLPPLPLKRTA
jgi:hypothetical protein